MSSVICSFERVEVRYCMGFLLSIMANFKDVPPH